MIPTEAPPMEGVDETVDGFGSFAEDEALEREMDAFEGDGPVDAPDAVSGAEDSGDDVPDGAELTDEADDEVSDAPSGLRIDGDGQVSLDVGGEVPTLSTVALQGRKIELAGQFEKGELVELRVVARVGGVHFDDKTSADGDVIDTTRKHILRIEEVSKA